MIIDNKYTIPYEVPFGYVDEKCRFTALAFVGLAQELAALHYSCAGLSIPHLQQKGLTWIISKQYFEIYEYPRGQKAVVTYTEDGHQEIIEMGKTSEALMYEVLDMEEAVAGDKDEMYLHYSRDVMKIMTDLRKEWGMTYPEEEK